MDAEPLTAPPLISSISRRSAEMFPSPAAWRRLGKLTSCDITARIKELSESSRRGLYIKPWVVLCEPVAEGMRRPSQINVPFEETHHGQKTDGNNNRYVQPPASRSCSASGSARRARRSRHRGF